jgi:Beta-galactosidase/Glycosyl hydrolase family 53
MFRALLTLRRVACVLTCAGCCSFLLVGTAAARPAHGARLHAPPGFFGTVVDEPAAIRADQLGLMRSSGVETIRVVFNWDQTEPTPGAPNFAALDQTVALASQAGLKILPIVLDTPQWASSNSSAPNYYLYAPSKTSDYTGFLRALVARYGPRGSFWSANPGVRKIPIRQWQIWNEPAFKFFWASQPYYKTYPKLLKAAYKAVHSADRGAKVVTAGLANNRANPSWKYMKRFYRYGFKHSFDILALHPFASSVSHLLKIIQFDRAVLKRYGDGGKPVYLTEMSWPASVGQIPTSDYLGFETTPAKQAKLIQQGFAALLRNKGLRVRAAFWYDWASRFVPTSVGGTAVSFQYAGLTKYDGVNTFTPTSALSAYSKAAHAYG